MKEFEPYLIVVDLDGTLLYNYAEWDSEAMADLKKLNAMGHIVMIATGRPFRSSYFVYQALNLNSPLINYNGALVTHPLNKNFPVTDLRINRFDLFKILDFIGNDLINVFCEIHDDIYVLSFNEDIHPYLHTDGGIMHEGKLSDTLPDDPNGCILFVTEKMVKHLSDYINDNYSDTLRCRYWGEDTNFNIMEIYNKNVNKGTGVKSASSFYHIPKQRIITIGDGHNDIEMFMEASICVAMENAHQELLPLASHITKTNHDHGVSRFLHSFFPELNENTQ